MSANEKQEALRLLAGLENGSMSGFDAGRVADGIDPVLVYFVIRYLREAYPASDPAATAVLDRVVGLTSEHPALVAKSKTGERDPVSVWFLGDYSFRDYRGRGRELIEMIADKLEA